MSRKQCAVIPGLTRNPAKQANPWIPGQARNDGVGPCNPSKSFTSPFKPAPAEAGVDANARQAGPRLTVFERRRGGSIPVGISFS
jgi:hypothetical protein